MKVGDLVKIPDAPYFSDRVGLIIDIIGDIQLPPVCVVLYPPPVDVVEAYSDELEKV
jgi:hypothetical protein